MPWKECSVMDERVRFGACLLDGEKMAALCREFAISRKTGYKILDRYKESGLEALTDRSRRTWRYGNQLPQQVETAILNLKREKPYWGARKIRERLLRRFSCKVKVRTRSPRTSPAPRAPAQPCSGHAVVFGAEAQRTVVHRLQGRVSAGQQKILLPADRHRSR